MTLEVEYLSCPAPFLHLAQYSPSIILRVYIIGWLTNDSLFRLQNGSNMSSVLNNLIGDKKLNQISTAIFSLRHLEILKPIKILVELSPCRTPLYNVVGNCPKGHGKGQHTPSPPVLRVKTQHDNGGPPSKSSLGAPYLP